MQNNLENYQKVTGDTEFLIFASKNDKLLCGKFYYLTPNLVKSI